MDREKLSLQADDVRFIRAQFLKAAEAKIELNLPATDETDPMKQIIRQRVLQFIDRSVDMSRYAMMVDGVDMSAEPSLYKVLTNPVKVEPFDAELNARVKELYAELEERELEVAQLRKSIPALAIERYNEVQEMLNQQSQMVDKETDEVSISNLDKALGQALQSQSLHRLLQDYHEIVEQAARLKDQMPRELEALQNTHSTISRLKDSGKEIIQVGAKEADDAEEDSEAQDTENAEAGAGEAEEAEEAEGTKEAFVE